MEYDISQLERFRKAQQGGFFAGYEDALREVKGGRKQDHWIWYIFPQIKGLGNSDMAQFYGISSIEEAQAYLADESLGGNLREITKVFLSLDETNPFRVFPGIDGVKVQSCMTLFLAAAQSDEDRALFSAVLDKYYGGNRCKKTVTLLGGA